MARPSRAALTLVEVVVLIVFFALVLTLFFPSIQHQTSPSRRNTCLNNQKQIRLAIQEYEAAQRRLPGYVNRLTPDGGGTPLSCSWVVPVLPFLERADVWWEWRSGNPTGVHVQQFICSIDRPDGTAPLSYVVNCGLPGDDDTPATGLFFNHDMGGEPVTISLGDIPDGAQNTLMLSENIQAGRWTDTEEANLGMVWRRDPDECSPINACLDVGDCPGDVRYARPSSYHPGGVNVTFCDGSGKFLSDMIDYRVCQHLMTPDSAAAGVPGKLDEQAF